MSVRWWWADTRDLGMQYVEPGRDVTTGEPPAGSTPRGHWEDDVTEAGALVLGDGNDALVIEGNPEQLHNFLLRLRAVLPDPSPRPFYTGPDYEPLPTHEENQA